MKCQGVMEYMQRFLDHDLSEREQNEMRNHIEQCTSCAEMFERLSRLSDELVQLPKVVPPFSIVDSIMPKLDEIDRENRLAAADAVHSPSMWEKLRSFASLRTLGSIAAAGLLLVIAITQGPQWLQQAERSMIKGEMQESSAAGGASSSTGLSVHSASATSANRSQAEAPEQYSVSITNGGEQSNAAIADDGKINNKASLPGSAPVGSRGADIDPPVINVEDQSGIPVVEDQNGIAAIDSGDAEISAAEEKVQFTLNVDLREPTGIPSPGGHYYALVETSEEGLQMIILNEVRERIYASPLKQAEYVSEIAWSEDGETLDYAVFLGEEETWFTIDVQKRLEIQK